MAVRPVKARAALSAIRFASVPELVKRTMSSEGKRSHMISASRPSRGVGPPKVMPWARAEEMARWIAGSEWP